MDGSDPRAYALPRRPFEAWEERKSVVEQDRTRRGLDLLTQISRTTPQADDDLAELRDVIRTAVALGVGQ
ncbi:hypothetical protein DEF23_17690 [Marinitenerispora sediminis]|uniref:Uncharacterized protein n=2 Tax=Marinitenerispora sediminis TaxID=1931232 RepID=A0A368T3U1_9ACTN|nr:hypothetical protein DEF28_20100 [Marinitenerispora sediminis]RCV53361.1 hypothetical protein DEF23_17690 [Marinitenerispora sediminis]RCV57569.1 hypothetical protein DEF24_15010 [Marinitenerispora sediminis]